MRAVLGDGESLGIRLRYVEEPEPLGTGGALKFAEDLLEERFFMLNGDVLTDIDLTAQLAQHERTGARATLALIAVEDPSAYGPGAAQRRPLGARVPREARSRGDDRHQPDQCRGLHPRARGARRPAACGHERLDRARRLPALVGNGLYGCEARAYWLDIGTPARYLQATYDILDGHVHTEVGDRLAASGMRLMPAPGSQGRVAPPAVLGDGCEIAENATVGSRIVLGRNVIVGDGAHIESSVVLDGVAIGARSTVRGAIVGPGVRIGEHCHLDAGVVLGEGVELGADNTLTAGARIFPGVRLPDGAIRF